MSGEPSPEETATGASASDEATEPQPKPKKRKNRDEKRAPTLAEDPALHTLRATGQARRTFTGSALLLLTGIALSAADEAALGSWIAVAGLVGAIWGTHQLGRLGIET